MELVKLLSRAVTDEDFDGVRAMIENYERIACMSDDDAEADEYAREILALLIYVGLNMEKFDRLGYSEEELEDKRTNATSVIIDRVAIEIMLNLRSAGLVQI